MASLFCLTAFAVGPCHLYSAGHVFFRFELAQAIHCVFLQRREPTVALMILVWSLTFSVVPVTIASSPVYGPSVNVNQSPLFKSMTAQLVDAKYGSSLE